MATLNISPIKYNTIDVSVSIPKLEHLIEFNAQLNGGWILIENVTLTTKEALPYNEAFALYSSYRTQGHIVNLKYINKETAEILYAKTKI